MRIDKYIWCVRLSKTRSLASKLCESDKVQLNNAYIKPSKSVKPGDTISIKAHPSSRSYKVLDVPKSRLGAKLVADYMVEFTSSEDLKLIKDHQENLRYNKSLGLKGRPTKKDRRDLKDFME